MRNTKTILLLVVLAGAIACNPKPSETAGQTAARAERHYKIQGKVVGVDKQSKMLNLDGEAVPGFMDAMTMPYRVKPESELDKLHPGEEITADLMVEGDRAWLENVRVIGGSPPGSSH